MDTRKSSLIPVSSTFHCCSSISAEIPPKFTSASDFSQIVVSVARSLMLASSFL
jgi:hypothetical protein